MNEASKSNCGLEEYILFPRLGRSGRHCEIVGCAMLLSSTFKAQKISIDKVEMCGPR